MDLDTALRRMPQVYAEALRLRDEGFDALAIAERLLLPPESMPSLFKLADAKLAALMVSKETNGSYLNTSLKSTANMQTAIPEEE
jgi:hypothetical protein